jgi:inner membrane protein
MPTILTHPAIPLALGIALGPDRISRRLLLAGMVAAIVPDMDVIAFKLGIEYGHQLGHRGASHSIAFALALGMLAALAAPWLHTKRWVALAFVSIACVSHPLLDMLTTGGLGAAIWWPFSDQRHFFPVQYIRVSPLTMERFLGPAGLTVIKSELLWVWLPCIALMLTACATRREAANRVSGGTTRAPR